MIGVLLLVAFIAAWIAFERLTDAGLSELIDGGLSLFDRNDNTAAVTKSLLLAEVDDDDDDEQD